MADDDNNNMADIAELCKRDFVNARRTVDSVKDLFTRYSHILPTQSKEDMLHSLTSLGIAIQEAITEISDPTRKPRYTTTISISSGVGEK
jgi:hypothetical protein